MRDSILNEQVPTQEIMTEAMLICQTLGDVIGITPEIINSFYNPEEINEQTKEAGADTSPANQVQA